MPRERNPLARRESLSVSSGRVLAVGLGTGLFLGLSMLGLYGFYRPHLEDARVPFLARFPEPRIQSDPAGDLRDLQAFQREQVEGYAWVDRGRGLARVPVARAMDALGARGEAAYAPLEAPEPGSALPVRPEAARRAEGGR